ncbi:MAG: hypothetical protein SF123_01855 [Chloroflexota bacterium]|nr:hypothetical protein [Chloroflexota bacterium]
MRIPMLVCCLALLLPLTIRAQSDSCEQPYSDSLPPILRDIAWSPDGKQVAAFDANGFQLYEAVDWDAPPQHVELDVLHSHSLAYSQDSSRLVVTFHCTQSEAVTFWAQVYDAQTRDLLHEFPGAFEAAFIQQDTQLITAGWQIQVWALETEQPLQRFGDYYWGTHVMAVHPDEPYLLAGNLGEGGHIWNYETGVMIAPVQAELFAAAFTPDGAGMVYSGRGEVTFQSLDDPTTLTAVKTGVEQSVNAIAFHPTLDLLAVLHDEGALTLLNTGGDILGQYESYASDSSVIIETGIAFSPDGQWLATPGNENAVILWQVEPDGALTIVHILPEYVAD